MTVYVIDDHPLMRDALTMLIHRVRPGLKVVAVPKLNVLETAVEKNGPAELFCLDLHLPDTLGMSGVHSIKARYPEVPLAVVTSSDASEYEDRCLEAGANVFIEKTNNPTQIIGALREMLAPEDEEEAAAAGAAPTKLSKRQKQLILMLDQGLSNRDIAEKLSISEHTVKVHFWRLFRRLGVNSRTQALHFARTNGWLGI